MSDMARDRLKLRAIDISTRSALAKSRSEAVKQRVKDRADELLAQLEATVMPEGGNEEVLAAIESARRELCG